MCGSVCIHSMWILNLTQYASMLCKINITLRTSGLGFSSILHLNNFTKLSFITKSKLRVLLYNFRLNKQCPKQRTNWKSEIENFQFKITIKQNTAQYNKKKTIVLLEVGHYSLTIFTGVVRCWRQMPRGGEKNNKIPFSSETVRYIAGCMWRNDGGYLLENRRTFVKGV